MAEEKAVKPAIKTEEKKAPSYYQEWRVDIKNGKAEKLKIVRPVVKITDQEANTLNEGVLSGFSTAPIMYFKPE
jgi:hypothetical protein